jgi:NAD(P)-dependent dehydrogenase (short-subunit alcohol dehydrogenase family)
MGVELKRVREQVFVITGASSGIGLVTARMASDRGARVVLNSRDATDLEGVVQELRGQGGRAVAVAGDVADPATARRLAETAEREYGGIDTWINNAGVTIYGRIEEVTIEDARRLFETNYWGVVNGSLAALPYLKRRGGALINVGSILSETGYPLQGHYVASKHAVKGFTDSLRLELENEGAAVAVTLIQPGAIDTPYPLHAKNYLDTEPKHVPPVYAPELVGEAILHCAEHAERDLLVGGGAKMFSTMERWAPRIGDRVKEAIAFDGQRTSRPSRDVDALHAPQPGDNAVRGNYPGMVRRSSAYTTARLNPAGALLGLAIVGAGVTLAAKAGFLRHDRHRDDAL